MTFQSRHIGNRKSGGGNILRLILMLAILFFMVLFLRRYFSSPVSDHAGAIPVLEKTKGFWPEIQGEMIHHSTFVLDYNEAMEQPHWVAYVLTRGELNRPSVGRTDWFEKDTSVSTGSAEFFDYKNSGYSKGHLIPSADRVWNREVNKETFLMSNICPQKYYFNGGIWRELEENIRDWARVHERLYIITGPVFEEGNRNTIGKNQVGVPSSFFKVVLEMGNPEINGIGFIIPNDKSDLHLDQYAMTIDEVEENLGYDFFSNMFDPELEGRIEGSMDPDNWQFDEKRFNERIEIWNNR